MLNKTFLISIFFLSGLVRLLFFNFHTSHDDFCKLAFDSDQYQAVAENVLAVKIFHLLKHGASCRPTACPGTRYFWRGVTSCLE